MNEVLVDIRKYDLADRLGVDMITVEELTRRLEDALDEIEILKDNIKELNNPGEPDPYDEWHDRQMVEVI